MRLYKFLLLFSAVCSLPAVTRRALTKCASKRYPLVTKAEAKRRAPERPCLFYASCGRRADANGSMPFTSTKIEVTECHFVGALKAQRSPLLTVMQEFFVNNVTKIIHLLRLFQADLFVLVLFYIIKVKFLNIFPFL